MIVFGIHVEDFEFETLFLNKLMASMNMLSVDICTHTDICNLNEIDSLIFNTHTHTEYLSTIIMSVIKIIIAIIVLFPDHIMYTLHIWAIAH